MEPSEIVLTIPGTPEFLRLARMAAADAASRVGLTYEEIDDLRIAVDELCFAVMGDDGVVEPLTLVYQIHPGAVSVSGSCPGSGQGPVQSELSRTIVAAVVDEHLAELLTYKWGVERRSVDRLRLAGTPPPRRP